MINIQSFSFNPFSENTYVLYDQTKECVIIDPGCYTPEEKDQLVDFIEGAGLKPVRLLNTHCHIDHVLGNKFIAEKYSLGLEMHQLDLPVLHSLKGVSKMYGIPCELSPEPARFLTEKDVVKFGESELSILFAPGHSPGSIVFYCAEQNFAIAGDVLFRDSIGRYDFPGGDYETLMRSIKETLFALPDQTRICPGHGEDTTIGHEKKHNPFLQG